MRSCSPRARTGYAATIPISCTRSTQPTAELRRTIAWGFATPDRFVIDGDSIWVTDRDAPRIVRIDLTTRAQGGELRMPDDPSHPVESTSGMAIGEGSLWVAGTAASASVVVQFDLRTGRVQDTIPVPYVGPMAFGDGSLWVVGHGDLLRVDPATSTVVARANLDTSDLSSIAFGNHDAWTADPVSGSVWKIAPRWRDRGDLRGGPGLQLADVLRPRHLGGGVARRPAHRHRHSDRRPANDSRSATARPSIAAHGGRLLVTLERSAQDQIAALPGTVLRVATNGDPFSPADPAWNGSFFFRQIAFATCARLVRYEDSGVPDGWTLVPEVASMPDVSA